MKLTGCLILLAAVLPLAHPSESAAGATPFAIHWTAPGDDSLTGKATAYELRYSSQPITAANYAGALKLPGLAAPKSAGAAETFVVNGLPDNYRYYLAMKAKDDAGNWSKMSNVLVHNAVTTGVDEDSAEVSFTISFSEPRPNPARTQATWAFALPRAAHIEVEVFDITGRHIQTIASGTRGPGNGEVSWDLRDAQGRQVDTGVYFVRGRFDNATWTKRLTVVH